MGDCAHLCGLWDSHRALSSAGSPLGSPAGQGCHSCRAARFEVHERSALKRRKQMLGCVSCYEGQTELETNISLCCVLPEPDNAGVSAEQKKLYAVQPFIDSLACSMP